MDDERKAWDQMPEEPDRAYACFLVYLHLGPGRSIEKAYQAYAAGKSRKSQTSGQWLYYSSQYGWPARAAAFDVAMLSQYGTDVVVNWVRTLAKLSEMAFDKVNGDEIKISNLRQLLEVIGVLGNFVTPETVQAAREFASGNFGQPVKDEVEGEEEEL